MSYKFVVTREHIFWTSWTFSTIVCRFAVDGGAVEILVMFPTSKISLEESGKYKGQESYARGIMRSKAALHNSQA